MTDAAHHLRTAGNELILAADALGGTPPVEPPPADQKMIVMSAAAEIPWRPNAEVYEDLEDWTGPMGGYHGYNSGTPDTYADHICARVNDAVPRPYTMPNIKTWDPDRYIEFALTCPPGTFLLCQHEPDNPSKGIDPAKYRQFYVDLYTQAKALRDDAGVVHPSILVCQNLMSWTFKSASGRNPEDWVARMPDGSLAGDVLLVNGYDSGPNAGTAEAADIFQPFLTWLYDNLPNDTRWGVGEYGCHIEEHVGQPNGAGVIYEGGYRDDPGPWTTRTNDWFAQRGAVVAAWFHSAVGPEGPWYMNQEIGNALRDWMATP